ncbi:MAG: hypothetical protein KDA30_09345 [Phycisphaerales bacterium]|nr:hypothetical protein [Phycisphaerales bacterium]
MTEPTPPDTPSPKTDTAPAPRAKRKRSKRHSLPRVILALAVILLLITQTGVLRFAVLPAIENMLGCEATSGRVYVSLTGRVIVKDLELRAPALQQDAARFFRAPRAEFVPDFGGIIGAGSSIRALRINDATIRVSQAEDQSLNLMKLNFAGGGGGGGGGSGGGGGGIRSGIRAGWGEGG